MGIKLQLPKIMDLRPRLTVVGVGGAGCNAVNNMIAAGLTGVEFIVANTDAQALAASSAEHRIQLGANLTEGLGAGSKPEIGEAAAEEAIEEIRGQIAGAHMLFIAAGMGGGTGTGAASVIARTARELGILTVGIVTKPFQFEGTRRLRIAEAGIAELKAHVDTLIVIPNQNLFRIANERTTFAEAFVLADQVLYSGVACIVDLVVKEGLINLDFADVRTIMSGMGTAMMGTGEAAGERRAMLAAEEAIANPLLDDVTLRGARGLLLSITGGPDLTLYEVDEAASRVRQEVDPDANIIVGATFDESLGDRVRVSIVASGMAVAGAGAAPSGHEAWPRGSAVQSRPVSGPTEPPAAKPGPLSNAQTAPPAALAAGRLSHPAEDALELQRRLSDAMQPQVGGFPGHDAAHPPAFTGLGGGAELHPASELMGHHDGASHETWMAPGDVMIETGPETGRETAAARSDLRHPGSATVGPSALDGYAYGYDPDEFTPAPTTDIRRPQRRSHEPETFPAAGQRDYRGKSGAATHGDVSGRSGAPTAQGGAVAGGSGEWGSQARPPAEVTYQRPGLLQRITGLGRWGGESPVDSQRGAPPSPARGPVWREEQDAQAYARARTPGSERGGRGSRR